MKENSSLPRKEMTIDTDPSPTMPINMVLAANNPKGKFMPIRYVERMCDKCIMYTHFSA